ncbi:caspase-8-like isoform 1-T5 [Pholidichthys leucotaenia]
MSAALKSNKTKILSILSADYRLILNKVLENRLITDREYNNLRDISKEDVEGHVVKLVDKILNKGEDISRRFLNLLQTDEDIKMTFPQLSNVLPLPALVQASVRPPAHHPGVPVQESGSQQGDCYPLKSQPVGLCLIINNERFSDGTERTGTNKDAETLAEMFSWLRFRVLMCKDQTRDQMDSTLTSFASMSGIDEHQLQEWSEGRFTSPQEALVHGDAFVCCILSHGRRRVVLGTDRRSISIKSITRKFKATDQSALTGKPKIFLIQACQVSGGPETDAVPDYVEADDAAAPVYIPEEADFLVAVATVEDYPAYRHRTDGSWFVQTLCEQLREACPRREDLLTILLRVNDIVSQKEALSAEPGKAKQMPEPRFTLRKALILSPQQP